MRTLLLLILCYCLPLYMSAQEVPEYKNAKLGIAFKYLPGFKVTDISTPTELVLRLAYKDLKEVYDIKSLPPLGTPMKQTAQSVYDYFKKVDMADKAMTKFTITPLTEIKPGYTFLETFEMNGIEYETLIMMAAVPTGKAPGVLLRVSYAKKFSKSVTNAATMMIETYRRL